ncbi:MAG TPA: acyltransferase domain-containing protein [Desulfobacteraceae bacterium]|nr:acyltransferase domain-containing protein [Desulfobacteraceae bacterium]
MSENLIGFLYPGQGSQKVGMGHDLYQKFAEAREVFDQADSLLGFSLSRLCFKGPEEELNRDLNTQLAVYTVSCILTDLLKKNNVVPSVVSGYSSGFYSAAYAAGCFSFADGLEIVKQAGEILLEAGRKVDGNMAVIFGLSYEQVESACGQAGDADVAIFNTPRQIIISGITSSVKRVMELCLEKGALDVYLLNAEVPYHSRFVEKSCLRLLHEINDRCLSDPHTPLISYLLLESVADRMDLKKIIAAQLSRPVLWVDLIRKMHNSRTSFVEVGPGEIISRSVRWINRNIRVSNTSGLENLLNTVKNFEMSDGRVSADS